LLRSNKKRKRIGRDKRLKQLDKGSWRSRRNSINRLRNSLRHRSLRRMRRDRNTQNNKKRSQHQFSKTELSTAKIPIKNMELSLLKQRS
jgi:hypothetical protein